MGTSFGKDEANTLTQCCSCNLPYYGKLTLHEIRVLEIKANLEENDFQIKEINWKERVTFQNEGN